MVELPPKFNCGHDKTPENIYKGKNGSGNPLDVCRQCMLLHQRERRAKIPKNVLSERRRKERERQRARQGITVKQPLEYLKLTPRQAATSDAFNEAIDLAEARPLKCEKPEVRVNDSGLEYDYYPHVDFDEERPPSIAEAAKMCAGCPVIEMCQQYGKVMRAKNIVYGGSLFGDVAGKIIGGEK